MREQTLKNNVLAIRNIFTIAGVSMQPVSYVLNNCSPIAPQTRKCFIRHFDDLKYSLHALAQIKISQRKGDGQSAPQNAACFYMRLVRGYYG
jgi:DNA-binding LacI/PurR family transcriptional regulator